MRVPILVLLVVFSISVVHAQSLRKKSPRFHKALKSMLQPRKVEIKPRPKLRPKTAIKVVRVQPRKPIPKTFTVDYQWMAHYWELEIAWDYWIPEDDQIKFKDGKYIVPIVVFKHYEDMANTARRPSAATSIPAISPFD